MTRCSFLELPAELQVRIISQLDARSILACREASAELAWTIDDSVELQYRLELALAGMVDGPPSDASVRDRLDALRAYRSAWAAGAHPVHRVAVDADIAALSASENAAPIAYVEKSTGRLRIYAPPAPFSGLAEREEAYGGAGAFVAVHPGGFAVDPERDLLAYTWDTFPTPAEQEPAHAKCGFASLSTNFCPHPLAALPTLNACLPIIRWGGFGRLQCSGDVVGWFVSCGENAPTEMMVINWKTGVVVWHMHGSSDQHFKIVSSTHLVLIDGRDLTLRLYAFDSSASVDSPLATAEDCLYVLGLPACADWVSDKYINSAFEPVAKHALGEKPLFTHDTASALLVLQIYLMFPGPEADSESECSSCDDGPASEQFLLVIPVRTLLQFSTDAETTAARLPQASVISWEDWGPRGTRMLALRPYARAPTVLGARVALKDWSEYPGACVVTLYEVHELADRSSPASATSGDQLHQPPDASAVDHVDAAANAGAVPVARDDDWLRDTVTWKNAVHTTYPCRKTTRFIPLDESKNEGSWSSVVRLTHDGLLLIVQCRN